MKLFHKGKGPFEPKIILSLISCLAVLFAQTQAAYATFGNGSPTIFNPSVFTGNIDDQKIDGSTGAFTQRVPLDVPPGRNGLQPDVTLDYSSQRTQDGIVGYGWSLSIPYIERMNKMGSQTMYGKNSTFSSSIEGKLAFDGTTGTTSISDSIPSASLSHDLEGGTSLSFPYTVPSGGQNNLLMVLWGGSNATSTAMTLNGVDFTNTAHVWAPSYCQPGVSYHWYAYLPSPTSGTLSINWSVTQSVNVAAFTVKNAAQSAPIDADNLTCGTGSSWSTSVTTKSGNDLLISFPVWQSTGNFSSYGTGESQITNGANSNWSFKDQPSWKAASPIPGTETMTTNIDSSRSIDIEVIAVKPGLPVVDAGTTTSFRARTDTGSHTSYSYANNTWTVYDKHGTRYLYGSDDTGRMFDTSTGTSTNTYRWYLQEVRDTNGNYIKYTYLRDNNVVYPYKIIYTGNGSTDGISTVAFATSTRLDARLSYATGFAATTTQLNSQITAAVNGATVRQYSLGYGTGDNGSRSLLTSVQPKGYDENNNLTTLPAMIFSYATTSKQFYAPGNRIIESGAYVVADTDADGINDTNLFMNGTGNGYLFHDNDQNATPVPNINSVPPEYWALLSDSPSPIERGVRYLDINGDGRADAVRGWSDDSTGQSDYAIYYNQYATSTDTYSWTATSTNYGGVIPTFTKKTSGGLILTGGLFGDVNGDGLPDYITALPGTFATTSYLGNGLSFDSTTTIFVAPKSFPTTAPTETASQLVDINNDGLDDWVYSSGGNIYVLLNTSTGWASSPSPQWTFATSTLFAGTSTPTTYYDRGIRFMDINGDGLPDLVRAYQNTGACSGPEVADVKAVYLNTGNGWATSTAYTLPAYIVSCSAGKLVNNEYANFNGNGQMPQDVLSSVTYSKGGAINVAYKESASHTLNPGAAISLLVASTTAVNDGRGNYATTSYAYSGGLWYTSSTAVRDRRFAGFSPVTVTKPDGIETTYYGQNSLAQIGRPLRADTSDNSGVLERRIITRWDTTSHGDSTFVGLGRQLTQDFGADGSHRDSATDYAYSTTTVLSRDWLELRVA